MFQIIVIAIDSKANADSTKLILRNNVFLGEQTNSPISSFGRTY
jgi:hypothetical protein